MKTKIHKPYQPRPDLKGLAGKEYHRRHMRLWRAENLDKARAQSAAAARRWRETQQYEVAYEAHKAKILGD